MNTESTVTTRLVTLEEIVDFIHAEKSRVIMALSHLASNGPSAIEVQPGNWIVVSRMDTPAAIKRGKVLEMPKRKVS